MVGLWGEAPANCAPLAADLVPLCVRALHSRREAPATYEAAREAGYRLAFSFYGGFNRLDNIERFNVRRLPVGPESVFSLFQLQATVGLLTGTRWL